MKKAAENEKPNPLFEATVKNMLSTPPKPREIKPKPKSKKKTGK